jgi:diacylglycerol kinase family enzyme
VYPEETNPSLPKLRIKLIFNPNAGAARRDKPGLPDILPELQKRQIEPDICVLEEGCNLALELKTALSGGIRVFAVCGGDGTISRVCDILAGTDARIAIIPTGTRNNNAKSLNIPTELPECVALIRSGRVVQVDAGVVRCGGVISHFLEIVSVGLVSALNESGDALQHGKLASIGEFLSTIVSCPPAQIRLTLDGQLRAQDTGYAALVTNMPYCGFHFEFGHALCNRDGLLNVLYFSDLSKPDLLKYISQGIYLGKPEDPRIKHYLARTIDITTEPAMPVTADGRVIGEGDVHIEVREKAVGFIVERKEN